MKIDEFAKKVGERKRNIDYWTTLGLLHPTINESNGYRDYGDEAEREIKELLILKCAGMKLDTDHMQLIALAKKEPAVKEMLRGFIEGERARVAKKYCEALAYLQEV